MEYVTALAAATRALLQQVRSDQDDGPVAHLPESPMTRDVAPADLPVLRWLSQLPPQASDMTLPLVQELLSSAQHCHWQQTYRVPEVSQAFLDNYGWMELAGTKGPLPSGETACGFLLLGPHTSYPSHAHEAEEFYVPLAGTARWQRGDEPWAERSPGCLIRHRSFEPHAMQTLSAPLLALYVWRGPGLNRQARLVTGLVRDGSDSQDSGVGP